MKAIVFGGSGFLGSHVADILSERGYKVTIFDKEESRYLKPGQKMIIGNILDPDEVQIAVRNCDYVYNFAGIANLDDTATLPVETVRYNLIGNIHIIEGALKEKTKRYIYASSIYVYSQKGGFYRCSKQASELYIEEYHRRFGLEFTILRYGTLYGLRADNNNSVFRYLKQAMESGKIICTGSGEGVREYINVRDAARLSVDIQNEEYRNQHIIISGHYPMKFKDLVMMVKEILNKDIAVEFSKAKNPDHYDYIPYSFTPKIGKKLVDHYYTDMGQGLLECLHDMHDRLSPDPNKAAKLQGNPRKGCHEL